MSASPTLPGNSLRFLISPFDRLRFTLAFVLATGVGWLLVGLALKPLQGPVLPLFLQTESLLGAFVSGLVAGMIVGATQWIVLRRYIPDWLWILATAAGYVVLMTTLQSWDAYWQGFLSLNSTTALGGLTPGAIALLSALVRTLLATICAIWLGLSQWLLLRQYARPAWGWVFVPSLAVLVAASLSGMGSLFPLAQVGLVLEPAVLGAGALGMIQAIALAALRRPPAIDPNANPLIDHAPEIFDYALVNRLGKRLQLQLNQAWKSEHFNDRPLIYRVAVTELGRIVAYQPINQPAVDSLDQTPLPELVDSASSKGEAGTFLPLALYEVAFLPTGSLQVLSWRGMPLWWIGLGMVVLILAASAIAPSIANLLPWKP